MISAADVLDTPGELFEVIEGDIRVLQALVIEHEALDDELAKALGGPDPELRGDPRLDPVADGDDRVEVVEIERALHIPLALAANRQEFLVSCLGVQLAFLVDVLKMKAYVLLSRLKQVGHELLAEPDRFALEAPFELDPAALGFIDQELGLCREIAHGCSNLNSCDAVTRICLPHPARFFTVVLP